MTVRLACILSLLAASLGGCTRETSPGKPETVAAPAPHAGPRPPGKLPAELESFRPALEAAKLPYVRVVANKRSGTLPWQSKFRGVPYRPKGMAWPLDRDGQPMALLAQINFAEMPKLAGYPDSGLVQFFTGTEGREHVWGMLLYDEKPFVPERYFESLVRQDYFRVVYHPQVIQDAAQLDTRVARVANADFLPIASEAALTFTDDIEYVQTTDYRFKAVFGEEPYELFRRFGGRANAVATEYSDFTYREGIARVGGYAWFVQEDPRHIRADEDWLVLLQIQSGEENGVDVLWGDAGVGAFLIRRADLEKRDFSRVAYYWDNH